MKVRQLIETLLEGKAHSLTVLIKRGKQTNRILIWMWNTSNRPAVVQVVIRLLPTSACRVWTQFNSCKRETMEREFWGKQVWSWGVREVMKHAPMYVKSENFCGIRMKLTVYWDVTRCCMVQVYPAFGRIYYFSLQFKRVNTFLYTEDGGNTFLRNLNIKTCIESHQANAIGIKGPFSSLSSIYWRGYELIGPSTHSLMELSPSWEAVNCAATQEIIPAFYGTSTPSRKMLKNVLPFTFSVNTFVSRYSLMRFGSSNKHGMCYRYECKIILFLQQCNSFKIRI
jgi:hypothetical protein